MRTTTGTAHRHKNSSGLWSDQSDVTSKSLHTHNVDLTAVDAAIAALDARVDAIEAAHAAPPPPPPPPPPPVGNYDATYTATTAADQTAAFKTFIEAHAGKRVAIAGVVPLGQCLVTVNGITIDFLPGARIQGILPDAHGILRLATCWDVVLNHPVVTGTGYDWVGVQDPLQNQHGIYVDGGGRITIHHPVLRDVRGDGIYTGYQAGKNVPPVGVVINEPDIERASRNGISPVSGQVSIILGHIAYCGLDCIDFEPNDDVGAQSIDGLVSGTRLDHWGNLPLAAAHGPYAIAAGGYSTASKKKLVITGVTGDQLKMTLRDLPNVSVTGCTSDAAATVGFVRCGTVTFTGNSSNMAKG